MRSGLRRLWSRAGKIETQDSVVEIWLNILGLIEYDFFLSSRQDWYQEHCMESVCLLFHFASAAISVSISHFLFPTDGS